MLTHADVPFCLDEISADWLTQALREGGVLTDERVTDFSHKVIGEGAGFNGEVAILSLQYSQRPADAPESMVLKIPTALKNRVLGQTMGLYEKEIRFYRDLQPTLTLRTPRHYYSALDTFDDPDLVLGRMEGLNRMPIWLISILSKVASFVIARTPRRYALLIEDLSGYRLGDQMDVCSDEDTRRVLVAMAKFHGQFWDSSTLSTMSWVAPVAVTSRIIQMMFLQSIDKYRSANADSLSDRQLALIKWLKENGIALTEKMGEEPATLLHGDVRLDNVCFDDASDEVLLFDWQTMTRGPAGMDLAYFLSATVPAEASDSKISELIDFYHDQLREAGVTISPARLRWQYEIGMLAMLHRILPTLFRDEMDLGAERGPQMMQAWVDKIFSRVEGIEFETVLDRIPA